MFVIGQVKSDSLGLKQPIKPKIGAVNNQSCSSILLLTQLESIITYILSTYLLSQTISGICSGFGQKRTIVIISHISSEFREISFHTYICYELEYINLRQAENAAAKTEDSASMKVHRVFFTRS